MEIIGPERRTLIGTSFQVPFAVGYVVLPGIAYLIRDWRLLQLTISLPIVVLMICYKFVPESPRWLMTKRKYLEAERVLLEAARQNGRILHDEGELQGLMDEFKQTMTTKQHTETKDEWNMPLYKILKEFITLFATPEMLKRSLNVLFSWFVVAMAYYGVIFHMKNLSDNQYFMFFLSGVVEIPAYAMVVPLVATYGRKIGYCGTFLMGGAACIGSIFVPENMPWLSITMTMIGKFSITAAFAVAYLYTTELFPTVVRNVGVGAASMLARIGSIVTPYIVDLLSPYSIAIPSVIFGTSSILAGILSLLLPETNRKKLPETVDDVENWKEFSQTPSSTNYCEEENV